MFRNQKSQISAANLSWNDQGEPTSLVFNDIYFNTTDGLDETTYVFIQQNNLLNRWLACTNNHYVIAETGFGSGLNFLVTWQQFLLFRSQHPTHPLKRLYFTSFEKYPLTTVDLQKAHDRWPTLKPFATQLQQQYPMAIAGCHRLSFSHDHNSSIILDLWFGDIKDTITQVSTPPNGLVNTWYLDGFAPSKNPDMWNQALYNNMAKLSKNNASMATFTAAGDVRRGLQQAGFIIKKAKGFGKKREMITGLFNKTTPDTTHCPWYYRASSNNAKQVTIIGGGVASAALAYSLANKGINSHIICQDNGLAQGASGNLQGGFYPLINSHHDYLSQFYSTAFIYAKNIYQQLIKITPDLGDLCGVLELAVNDKTVKTHHKIITSGLFPSDFIRQQTQQQASTQSGVELAQSALFHPNGGWISPKVLTETLVEQAKRLATVTITTDSTIHSLNYDNNQWHLKGNQSYDSADIIVLANGHGIMEITQTQKLPLYATAGQVTHLSANDASNQLNTVLCYHGYITPAQNGQHCTGASFNRDTSDYPVNDVEHQQNLDKLADDVPLLYQHIKNNITGGKVGIRCSVKDHLPLVGSAPDYAQTKIQYSDLAKGRPAHHYENSPIHPNLYLIGGLGSRGLCSAPLLAEVLGCQLSNEPMPLPQSLLNQLNPNRYWIKQLKKHNVDF